VRGAIAVVVPRTSCGLTHRAVGTTERREEPNGMEIEGKSAMVVGGASGMARATAELLAARGAKVAILDRPQSAGQEVADGLGGTFHPCDVTDHDATEAAIDAAVQAL